MSSINIIGPGNRVPPARQDQRHLLRLALAALAMPAFFVIGFTLCYTSALQAPAPHGVPVAVAGPAAQTARLRDGLARAAGPAFDVQAAPAMPPRCQRRSLVARPGRPR